MAPKARGHLANVAVENDSVLPISNIRVLVQAYSAPVILPPLTGVYEVSAAEYTFPPCSILTTPVLQEVKDLVIHKAVRRASWKVGVQSVEFTDGSGVTWARSINGTLTQVANRQPDGSRALSAPVPGWRDIKNAAGCS